MKLLVDISGHGFGHLAQTAPVLNALKARVPELLLLVRSAISYEVLSSRIDSDFVHIDEALDFGFLMKSAVEVDMAASAEKYRIFHADWEEKVALQAEIVQKLGIDLHLSNISYLAIAAAHRANVPSVAFCSLNWAESYEHFFGEDGIYGQMIEAYKRAQCFLMPEPAMPMKDIPAKKNIGPVAGLGKNRRDEIAVRIGLKTGEKIGLISLGGIPYPMSFESWPEFPGIRFLASSAVERPDFFNFNRLSMDFRDVTASVDFLVSKPGYGSFVEAACLGLPVLYLPRRDWPEAPYLESWLEKKGRCLEVAPEAFKTGKFRREIEALFSLPAKEKVIPGGVFDAASFLADMLKRKQGAWA